MLISKYIPICDAITHLMHPLVEVVIHDINADQIIYISGNLSERQVGDPSLLETASAHYIQPVAYTKLNFDGKLIKSISIPIEDNCLLCINYDVSIFDKIKHLSSAILQSNIGERQDALFVNDWQENLHVSIHAYIQQHNLSFANLTNTQKKNLIAHLYNMGAFNERKAADYISKVLDLSRSTVFNYLKKMRQK